MPPHADEALHALLDDLSAPLQPAAPPGAPLLGRSATAAFNHGSLPDALAAANAALEAAGSPTRLEPLPDSSAGAAHGALAAALGAVVQLARGCEASARLRKDAEAKVDRLQSDVRALREDVRKQTAKRGEAERKAADVKRAAGKAARRAEEERTLLEKEKEDLRGKLAAVGRREGVLVFEGRRRDKELAKLQARVHDMLASRDAVRPPMVTAVAGTELGYTFGEGDFGDESAFYQAAENWPRLLDESYEERQESLVEEGRDMRMYVGTSTKSICN